MEKRLNYFELSKEGVSHVIGLEGYFSKYKSTKGKLNLTVIELVKMHASQINKCLYCLSMHTKVAMDNGEKILRLTALNAWREADLYEDHEKVALEFCEKLTKISDCEVSDSLYSDLEKHYTENEISDLALIISSINTWNRLCRAFKTQI